MFNRSGKTYPARALRHWGYIGGVIRRSFLIALATLCVSPALAQSTAPPSAANSPVRVKLETSAGAIIVAVDVAHAPLTGGNFLKYVDQKRLDGTSFYRAVGAGDQGFIQGGAQNDPKRLLPPVKHEPTSITGLTHKDGTISMARYAPGSATADFFICVGAMPSMDADPKQPGDNLGFAAFGQVVEGMEVVKAIMAMPKSPTQGEGVMKGQILAPQVRIISARRLPAGMP